MDQDDRSPFDREPGEAAAGDDTHLPASEAEGLARRDEARKDDGRPGKDGSGTIPPPD